MTAPASPVELPQLPQPHARITSKLGDMLLFTSTVARKGDKVYLDAETLNFGQQCYEAGVRAERERCAKLCEAEECGEQSEYGAGRDACSGSCAAAIRKGAP